MRLTVTAWFSNDAAGLQSEMVSRVAEYWCAKADGRPMPRISDIDLLDLSDIAPNLVLADVKPDPMEVRYRLVGPDVARFMHWDFTGEEVSSLKKRANSLEWQHVYKFLIASGQPVYGENIMPPILNRDVAYAFAIFPLCDESGALARTLGLEDYSVLTPADRAFAEGEITIRQKGPGKTA